jgi:hypothetical protein
MMSWPAPTGEPVRPAGAPSSAPPPADAVPTVVPPSTGAGVAPTTLVGGVEPAPTVASLPALPTTGAALAPLHARTGQPVRPWSIWAAAVLLFVGATVVAVGLFQAMWAMASPWVRVNAQEWTKIDKFNEATWLTATFPTEPAAGLRVLFAVLCCLVTVLVAGTAATVGYHAFAGYRWTRIGGLVAVVVGLLALLLNPVAAWSIAPIALGAGLLWLPTNRPFFARWSAMRHPEPRYSAPVENVLYGPLPRFR